MTTSYTTNRRLPPLLGPTLLIGVGAVLLLMNMGILPENTWLVLLQFWPVAIVLLGINLLFGRNSSFGNIFSAGLTLAVLGGLVFLMVTQPDHPLLERAQYGPEPVTTQLLADLDDFQQADVSVDFNSDGGSIGALSADSSHLIEGQITTYNEAIFEVSGSGEHAIVRVDEKPGNTVIGFTGFSHPRTPWKLAFNPNVLYSFILDLGSGVQTLDFSGLKLSGLSLDVGSGATRVDLPLGGYRVDLDAGSGALTISIPRDLPIRISIDKGSGALRTPSGLYLVSGEQNGNGVWESENYGSSDYAVEMQIDGGSGAITIKYGE